MKKLILTLATCLALLPSPACQATSLEDAYKPGTLDQEYRSDNQAENLTTDLAASSLTEEEQKPVSLKKPAGNKTRAQKHKNRALQKARAPKVRRAQQYM